MRAFSGRVTLFAVLNISWASSICSLCSTKNTLDNVNNISNRSILINKQTKPLVIKKSLSAANQVCPKTWGFKCNHMWTAWYLHINMLYTGHKTVLFAVQNTIPMDGTFSLTVRDRPLRWSVLLLPGVAFTGWSLIWVTCGAGRICITCFVGVVIAAWVWTAVTTGAATRPADVWSVSDGCGLAGLCHTQWKQ